ncbi:MAG: DUF4974 domain-containing protein [Dysgonamonadaceae bacterium]|jgi:ferric-dicitrate binding protein FerR (iron transport regulator)|nr:DUF4974 domain-containing protein [Dysgonamonadaceae bacterium]
MLKVIKNNYDKWELLCKVLSEEIPENNPEFQEWLEKDEDNKSLYLLLKNDQTGFNIDKIYQNIIIKAGIPEEEPSQKKIQIPDWIRYVSVIALLVTSGVWYYLSRNQEKEIATMQIASQQIVPGNKKAVLSLADGSSIPLDSEFQIEEANGISINNDTTGGRLNYNTNDAVTKKVEFHNISIPVGGEYGLKLSDGTQVSLNSDSKLTYPSHFEGNERRIKLEGEAFFDVVHNGQIFVVETENIELKVLGTSFNISSYGDDMDVVATLVSGSIEVKTKFNNESYLVMSGHQLKYNKESKEVSQKTVDTEIYTAWIRGKFIFRNQSMDGILTKLSRWYDFSINYSDPNIKELRFTGSAEKKRPINYLLNQIEKVTDIKFTINGKEITSSK